MAVIQTNTVPVFPNSAVGRLRVSSLVSPPPWRSSYSFCSGSADATETAEITNSGFDPFKHRRLSTSHHLSFPPRPTVNHPNLTLRILHERVNEGANIHILRRILRGTMLFLVVLVRGLREALNICRVARVSQCPVPVSEGAVQNELHLPRPVGALPGQPERVVDPLSQRLESRYPLTLRLCETGEFSIFFLHSIVQLMTLCASTSDAGPIVFPPDYGPPTEMRAPVEFPSAFTPPAPSLVPVALTATPTTPTTSATPILVPPHQPLRPPH
jgi:hypothetical protein